jgi:hypothetical protein
MKFDIGEPYKEMLSDFTYNLDLTILVTKETYTHFYTFTLITYQSKKCFKRKWQGKVEHMFYIEKLKIV